MDNELRMGRVKLILEDMERIDKEFISRKDYANAAEELESALARRSFAGMKWYIESLHCGSTFVIVTERLLENLREGKEGAIEANLKMALGYGAQTLIPGGR